jgi:excisionase family DNA binding protein
VSTVKAVAERLSCSTATVYGLIAAGRLRHYRIGTGRGAIRITEEQLAEFLSDAEAGVLVPPPKATLKHLRL